ncbi:MAG: succinate--CoA ligase subunit alpha [Alphaproteobacteria bacterium]|nr:succinate--CoA ligase subunit alpha [Alphaproteobacteria bacterium]
MSVLANKNTRVLVQGITGIQASFHVKRSMDNGTNVVAGTSPQFSEKEHLGVPVFATVQEVVKNMPIDASVLFVPARAVKQAVREAVEAKIKLIVSIAQGVPVHDMLEIKAMLNGSETLMIGPNTPGLITPDEARLGIFPENIHHKGNVGIISRASTLTYEGVIETNLAGLGQSTVIGLGDDMIVGTDYCPLLTHFMEDDETKAIVLIGKADNVYEQMAAEHYAAMTHKKPVIAFVAGETLTYSAPMGYAADIITHGLSSIQDKKKFMKQSGMIVVEQMSQIHTALAELKLL